MPRVMCTAPATLPLCSTSGPSRTSTINALPLAIISCACACVIFGTTAFAAATKSFADLAIPDDSAGACAADRSATCKHICVTTDVAEQLGKGFDNELGLEYLELTPDGGRARLEITDKLLQPWGIVHGGVYCSIIEGLASVSGAVWLLENGSGHVVGVNNNTDFLRAISSGTVTAVSTPIHRGRRQQLWLITITDDDDRVVARGQVRLQNISPE